MDAVVFLLALGERASAVMTADIRFWRHLTLYALSLVAGQQVIPYLEKDGSQLRAVWKPQPDQIDHLTDWSKAFPPVSRAGVEKLEEAPAPGSMVNAWVSRVVDQVVRQAAQGVPSNLLLKPMTPGGQWLKA